MRRIDVLRAWPSRRWAAALLGALVVGLLVALPTAVIPNPVFGRPIEVTWWSYPTVIVSAILGGLLLASYVRVPGDTQPERSDAPAGAEQDRASKLGLAGGFIAFFAVGCPVCNKLVLLALGASGAVNWFAPVQPFLALASIALMAYALWARLGAEVACANPRMTQRS